MTPPGYAASGGFIDGFAHPFSGIDHVLAMVALGVWGYQLGRPAMRLLPAMCVLGLSIGGLLAATGMPLPGAEAAFAASTIALWCAVVIRKQVTPFIACVAAAVISLLHGHVHGIVLSAGTSPVLYSLGLLGGTCLLYAWGVGLPLLDARQRNQDGLIDYPRTALENLRVSNAMDTRTMPNASE
jgi:urease accessory protein